MNSNQVFVGQSISYFSYIVNIAYTYHFYIIL